MENGICVFAPRGEENKAETKLSSAPRGQPLTPAQHRVCSAPVLGLEMSLVCQNWKRGCKQELHCRGCVCGLCVIASSDSLCLLAQQRAGHHRGHRASVFQEARELPVFSVSCWGAASSPVGSGVTQCCASTARLNGLSLIGSKSFLERLRELFPWRNGMWFSKSVLDLPPLLGVVLCGVSLCR